jgi:hypothetical protein
LGGAMRLVAVVGISSTYQSLCKVPAMMSRFGLVPFNQIREWQSFDSDIGKDSAKEIREYWIADFQYWKNHDVYRKKFLHLLHDLKAPITIGANTPK